MFIITFNVSRNIFLLITATLSSAASSMYAVWPSPSLPKLLSDDTPLDKPLTEVRLNVISNE